MNSNASIQDIIANSNDAYRNQEEMEDESIQNMGAEEPDEEELTESIMSLQPGDIAEIAKIMTEGVEYRTNEGPTLMNADKIRNEETIEK